MGDWKPGQECDAEEFGEQPISVDGWFCFKCGETGYWGDTMHHEQRPPAYSQSMERAWKIVEKMTAKMGYRDIGFLWRGPDFKSERHYLSPPSEHDTYVFGEGDYMLGSTCWFVLLGKDGLSHTIAADTAIEAICIAALVYSGVQVV